MPKNIWKYLYVIAFLDPYLYQRCKLAVSSISLKYWHYSFLKRDKSKICFSWEREMNASSYEMFLDLLCESQLLQIEYISFWGLVVLGNGWDGSTSVLMLCWLIVRFFHCPEILCSHRKHKMYVYGERVFPSSSPMTKVRGVKYLTNAT